MDTVNYIDVDDEVSFKAVSTQIVNQDENNFSHPNVAQPSSPYQIGKASANGTPCAEDRRLTIAVGRKTPLTSHSEGRCSNAQEILQDITCRLDEICDSNPGTPASSSNKRQRANNRMSVGFDLGMRSVYEDDFYAPKYSEAEMETLVEERCAELQKEHDNQLGIMRAELLNTQSRAETLEQQLQATNGESQRVLAAVASQLEELERKAEETANENILLKTQVSALAKQIQVYEAEGQAQAIALRRQLEENKARYDLDLASAQESADTRVAESARLHAVEVAQLTSQSDKAVAELTQQLNATRHEVEQLTKQTRSYEERIQAMQANLANEIEQTKTKVKESFRKKFEKGNQEYASLQHQHEASLQQIQTLKSQIQTLQNTQQEREASLLQMQQTLQATETKLAEERNQRNGAEQQVANLKISVPELEHQLEVLRKELADTAKERDAQMFAVARLVTSKEAMEAETLGMRSESEELKAQVKQLTGMNEQLLEMLEKYYDGQADQNNASS